MEIDINDAAGRIHTIPILFDEAAASIGQLRIVSIKLDAPCAELKHFSSNVDFERIEAELKRVAYSIAMIDAYQPFWDNFDEIDRQAFVVDGLGRSSCKRKIALGDNCFLHIEVADPLYPTELPSIRISGPEANTRPLEFKVVTNRKLW
ncbi:hypothetical protein BCR33DRAFT_787529 [Rhizoclosmatium globosum]|uniref:FANCL UBC-like domain-containing protein n=1 Tax=Rhizoclosmatium globosum TaxID=329046 RepID=A0A1Y2C051_9FUNG|nr:hypothetical protein BCR33DRAFT_787529 [Rhizoclosmatium globosum]|eukprot:ORY40408.1 hypothetical protein BCR33DRAFT_787529 [Rhizoclosmatium globosum]